MSIPAEAFVLPPAGRGSLQQRIRQMVTEGILSGRFRAGQKMPSSRGLAQHLGISRITVTLAYAELVSSDYLTARGRSGYYVSENAPRAPDMPARGPRAESPDFARLIGGRPQAAAQVERPTDWDRYPHSFIYGQADPTLFDHQNWRLCAVRALGRRDFGALTQDYYDRDDPLLIEHVLRAILPRRGIAAEPEEVLLTLGAQNALWIAAQVLLGPGRQAAVENPCYSGLRGVLTATGTGIVPVDVDAEGLPPEAIPPGVDAVFTTASHQCPTNATMPLERRLALLGWQGDDGFLRSALPADEADWLTHCRSVDMLALPDKLRHNLPDWLAERLQKDLGLDGEAGVLSSSMHRDDFAQRGLAASAQTTLPFDVNGADILVLDDVLYTGRTVRAVLNELYDYGRPARVRLAVLVDRGGRELPVQADFASARVALPAAQSLALARTEGGKFHFQIKEA